MARCQALQADREFDVTRSDDILNLEVGELGVESELLDDARVLARGKLAIILGFLFVCMLATVT